MHRADINASIYKAGWTQVSIAKHLGISSEAVTQTISSAASSYNVASFISSITGIPLNKLWPDGRYANPPKRTRSAA